MGVERFRYKVVKVPVDRELQEAIAAEMGIADLDAWEAERAEERAKMDPEVRAALDEVQKETERAWFGIEPERSHPVEEEG